MILNSEGFQHLVILYQPKGAVLLFDKEDRGGHGQLGMANSTGLKVLLEEGIKLILFSGRERIDLAARGLSIGGELNSMVPLLALW